MQKSSKKLTSLQPELDSSQTTSTTQQNSISKETSKVQEKQPQKLSNEQLKEAISMGSLLADQSEMIRLKLRHQEYLRQKNLKTKLI
jgi:uncharacterized FlaG/YvyC family protein